MARKRRTAHGFSLVETLIALAITGTCILTVVTLFVVGRKNVYSGKQMTVAVAVGTRVLEDLNAMSADDINSNFGFTDATALGNNPVAGKYYAGSAVVTSAGATTGYLKQWGDLIPASVLNSGRVSLVVVPNTPTDGLKPVTTATFVHIRVIVQWSETGRTRTAVFDTSKIRRS